MRTPLIPYFVCYSGCMYTFKEDAYRKNRGGLSRVLDITCDHCSAHVAYYQKTGLEY